MKKITPDKSQAKNVYTHETGCEVVEMFFMDATRYPFDFDICKWKDGWHQMDSLQCASYYGQWCSPEALQIVSYIEGDVEIVTAPDQDAFCRYLRHWEAFCNSYHKDDKWQYKYDPPLPAEFC